MDSDGGQSFDEFPMPSAGEVLDARYRVGARIGRGGMGVIHEAVHVELGRRCAIKFVRRELAESERSLERFQREARLLGGLHHDHITHVYDIGRYAGKTPFIVMEFLDGHTLREELEERSQLDAARALRLVQQACRAVAYAHERGVVHRDLKPDNLMLTVSSEGAERVKLLDFGIAQSIGPADGRLTPTGATLGTSHYMSPEQARGETHLEPSSDVYSLGVILYELLSGERPHGGSSFAAALFQRLTRPPTPLQHYLPSCPRSVLEIVERCLSTRPEERYRNAGELLHAMESSLEQLESSRTEQGALVISPRARGQSWKLGLLAAIVLLPCVTAILMLARANMQLRRDLLLRAEVAAPAALSTPSEVRLAPRTPTPSPLVVSPEPSSVPEHAGTPQEVPVGRAERPTRDARTTQPRKGPGEGTLTERPPSEEAPPQAPSLILPFVSRNPYE